jgi:glycosyltransferase involved in cell wall biosynthesis
LNLPAQSEAQSSSVRVLWPVPTFVRGYYWQPVLREFLKRFPNTVILTGTWPGYLPGYENLIHVEIDPRIRWVVWKLFGRRFRFVWAPPSALWRVLRHRADVMLTAGFNLFTLAGILSKLLYGTRIVLVFEGIVPSIALMNAPVRLTLRRLIARMVDRAICNSNGALEYLRDVLHIPEWKLEQHPLEVPEISALTSNDREGHRDCFPGLRRPVFIDVGQLIPRKGWRYLLQAARLLLDKGVDSFSIVFLGEGEDKAELERAIKELGLSQVAHLFGQIPYAGLGDYFQSADVFVLPTKEDTWGMVVLEAMALGKPVLVSRYAGSHELVHSGVNGFVFDCHKPEEIAEHMERFIREPELIGQFGRNSKEIIGFYTPWKAANALYSTIMKAVEGQPRRKDLEKTSQPADLRYEAAETAGHQR